MVSVQAFPQQVREACIKAAQNEIDESERGWGVMRVNERSVQWAYIVCVLEYKYGEAVEPSSKGLFETMAKDMAESS